MKKDEFIDTACRQGVHAQTAGLIFENMKRIEILEERLNSLTPEDTPILNDKLDIEKVPEVKLEFSKKEKSDEDGDQREASKIDP